MFLSDLREKHHVDDAIFLVDGASWFHAACHRHGLRFQHVTPGDRNGVKHINYKGKRRTNQFSNYFSHVEADTVKNWLYALAFAWNQLI